jgi:hypothetical protein
MECLLCINLDVCSPGDLCSSLPSIPLGTDFLEVIVFVGSMTSCHYRQIRDSRLFATKRSPLLHTCTASTGTNWISTSSHLPVHTSLFMITRIGIHRGNLRVPPPSPICNGMQLSTNQSTPSQRSIQMEHPWSHFITGTQA